MRQRQRLIFLVALLATFVGCKRTPDEPAASQGATLEVVKEDDAAQVPAAEPAKKHAYRVDDIHTHLNGAAIPAALTLFDKNGIDRVVNLSGGNQAKNFETSLLVAQRTHGRVVPYFNIDWSRIDDEGDAFGENIAKDFRAAIAAGYGGLKLSKGLGLTVTRGDTLLAVDDPLLDPIFEAAGELGVMVSIHTGDPKAFFEPLDEKNERWLELSNNPSWSFYGDEYPSREELLAQRDHLLAKHPKTKFVCVHFGGNPEDIDAVEKVLDTYPNAYVDIAARLGEIGRHDPNKVRALFIKHSDRIFFGTDFMMFLGKRGYSVTLGSFSIEPVGPEDVDKFFDAHWRFFETNDASMPNPVPIQGDWDLFPIGLPQDVLEAVYTKNAERLIFGPYDERTKDLWPEEEVAPVDAPKDAVPK
ncbi:MAG: hypothetical protein AUK47_18930 [Deltaproteobacteria bacterium CG2_30_63_29]|nr:MAG: hypothetical protein AUK47_18930 [Deltaproteobacteria bacterium CG2_30_63_29]PIW01110.1 MAG: amidohydrolase [Deltaproteobacteria bacterium CG17_big_fil_post_rev_8_21_14_2_50_63_7]PJB33232.1 MAG: amidohydrolase [Deltaproteobacteria bacterium CG_4_9_14_3_um_filter_63_12]